MEEGGRRRNGVDAVLVYKVQNEKEPTGKAFQCNYRLFFAGL